MQSVHTHFNFKCYMDGVRFFFLSIQWCIPCSRPQRKFISLQCDLFGLAPVEMNPKVTSINLITAKSFLSGCRLNGTTVFVCIFNHSVSFALTRRARARSVNSSVSLVLKKCRRHNSHKTYEFYGARYTPNISIATTILRYAI